VLVLNNPPASVLLGAMIPGSKQLVSNNEV